MRNIIKNRWTLALAFGIIGLSSCDKGFDEMNINKTAATSINPVFTLNNAVINTSFPAGTIFMRWA
jgi:hypothetical protein